MLLIYRELRVLKPYVILRNLCISLLGLYIVFLAGIEQTTSPIACSVITAVLQYFVVASLMWAVAEGVNMYYMLVLARRSLIQNFLTRSRIICWGTPINCYFSSMFTFQSISLDAFKSIDIQFKIAYMKE